MITCYRENNLFKSLLHTRHLLVLDPVYLQTVICEQSDALDLATHPAQENHVPCTIESEWRVFTAVLFCILLQKHFPNP